MPRNSSASQRKTLRGLMRLLGNHLESVRVIAPGSPAQHQAHRLAAALQTLVDATLTDVGLRSGVSLSDEDRVRQMQSIALMLSPPGGTGLAETVFQPAYDELQRSDLLEEMLSLASELRMHAFQVPEDEALRGRDPTPAQRDQLASAAMQMRCDLLQARNDALSSVCESLFHALRGASRQLEGAFSKELDQAAAVMGVRLGLGAKAAVKPPVSSGASEFAQEPARSQRMGGS